MSVQDTDNLPQQDELAALKARADLLGVAYHPSIGLEKLRDKINAAVEGNKPSNDEPAPAPEQVPDAADAPATDAMNAAPETENQKRARLKKEALKLVRVRVTCMNPMKKEWQGEIFTVGNAGIGSITKYVPFNADDGWHIPHILYQQLKERQCQVFYTEKSKNGVAVRKGKLIKEFAIEVLPPLTKEELAELARRQAMAGAID